ncbi:TRAP-type mannitol/chloroaromatic compound transport system, small permease component [Hoeflea sp. IMCC20628]|uniref:TRAP transporter small permease subunit n=1 Tax=Hoeflea sp. IMCC20628 TaxID=1620421 RepID=UPI00063ACBDE|nr:TRAP transporter small permease subunit [Hoeflea sp. IMCC20628]AKH99052.1 TRAP-type mannitol/chloroaromatic compound transport system, small permease component [Hoeflea sp. IMCC20628]
MGSLLTLSRFIDRINEFVGRNVSWLVLAAVLISAGNATIRKMFDMSSNAWLEVQWYLFGAVFMLAAGYTLRKNEHVRIDVLAGNLSKRARDWIDLFGHFLFLLPFCLMMTYLAWPFFWRSFQSGEMSSNAGGLIIWPAKASVLLGFILLTAQAVSEIIKRIAIIRGIIEDEPGHDHSMPPQVEAATDMKGRTDA